MKKILLVLFLLPFVTFSQTGTIKGKVTFDGLGKNRANVYVSDINIGTVSQKDGTFQIENVPVGKHTLFATYVGFKSQKKEISVQENDVVVVDFKLLQDVLGLDNVVISATSSRLNRKQAPVLVSVTNSNDLAAVQSVSLSEGLNFQPGLRFETNCQNCGYSQVRINGLEGAYTQILVDSRPTFSALAGIYGLDQIPVNTIDRVEVVRGGGSALYGSNAIAGTINIITKDPFDNTFQVSNYLGLIGGKSKDIATAVNGTVVSEDLDSGLSFFGNYRRRNSYDANDDGYTEIAKTKNNSFGAKGFLKLDNTSRLSAEFMALKEFRRGGNKLDLLPFQSNITEQIDSSVLLGTIGYEKMNAAKTDKYSFYVSGSFAENDNYYGTLGGIKDAIADAIEKNGKATAKDFNDAYPFGASKDKVLLAGGQYIHRFNSDVLTAGIESKHNKTNDIKVAINRNIEQILNTVGTYVQYEWKPTKEFKVLGGARLDYYSVTNLDKEDVTETVLNPRLNVLYKVNNDLRLRATYAKGFRAPQFFADDLHVAIAGGEIQSVQLADNLKSETSHSFTTSLDWSKNYEDGSQLLVTVAPFYTVLANPFTLEELEDNSAIHEKSNGDRADVMGVNLEFNYALSKEFSFQSGFTAQKGEYKEKVDLGEGKDGKNIISTNFLRSPSLYGNFIVNYSPTEDFKNNLSVVYTGSMDVDHTVDSRAPNAKELAEDAEAGEVDIHELVSTKNFFELNWKSAYNFSLDKHKHLKLQVSGGIQNILNNYQNDFDKNEGRDAAYIYGPSRPRTYFIGIKIGNNL